MTSSDVRFAFRSFRRQPAPALLVTTMLALGIAANIVVFSLVNGLFLRPFPFPDADRLVYINERAPKWNLESTGINFPDYAAWRAGTSSFDGIALYQSASLTLSDAGGAERVDGAVVTHNFMDVLGVTPVAGRMFGPDEDKPGGRRVVVISEGLWRERFGGDPNVAGKTLRGNGVSMEIVGVMPRHASFPDPARFWLAIQGDPNSRTLNYSYGGIGRLKAGVSIEAAGQDLVRAHAPTYERHDRDRNVTPYIQPLRDRFVSSLRTVARAMAAAVALLLVVACANVAAVMLARAIARRREMGIRLAVGASRWRLVRQLLVENLLLAAAGGLAGIVLGRWLLNAIVATATTQLPSWAAFDIDARVATFSLLITVAAAILFGWAPALHAIRDDVRTAMSDSVSGSTSSPRGARTLSWLIAAEFTLAAILLVSGGLLWRAFDRVRSVDPGFDTENVLTFSVALPPAAYRDNPARLAFWSRAADRLRSLPGVKSAGLVSCAPLSNCHTGQFYNVEGRRQLGPNEPNPIVLGRSATDGYLESMGIALAAGRSFTAADLQPTARAVIVNETFVRTFWPDASAERAIGRRLAYNANVPDWFTVVGVTRDVKHYGLELPMRPGVYFPPLVITRGSMTFALRASGDPAALGDTVRAAFRQLDPSLALYRTRTTASMLDEALRPRRLYSWMLGVFAALALALAVGGTYGVTSYLISQRRREIGIRVALGAGAREIVEGILARNATAIVPAVAIGLGVAVLLARPMNDILFGVSPRDPAVIAGAAAVLIAVAFAANYLPARRAAKTDPVSSLRT